MQLALRSKTAPLLVGVNWPQLATLKVHCAIDLCLTCNWNALWYDILRLPLLETRRRISIFRDVLDCHLIIIHGRLQDPLRRSYLCKVCINFRSSFFCDVLLLSVGLPVANAPDVLQPCGLLYYP